MSTSESVPTIVARRRLSRRWMFRSSLVWSFGNNFVSTTVVVFLAISHGLDRSGYLLGTIIAAPMLAGVLRMFAPVMIRKAGSYKRFCVAAYTVEVLFLWLMLTLGAPNFLPDREALACIAAFWCLANLAEHCGTVSLFAWAGELFAERTRGRFFGRRERWRVTGEILSLLVCAGMMYAWRGNPGFQNILPEYYLYATLAAIGTFFIVAGTWMLTRVQDLAPATANTESTPETCFGILCGILRPMADRRFWPMLAYSAYFSFVTQLEQVFQVTYPRKLFDSGLAFLVALSLRTLIRAGQMVAGPAVGRWTDRYGTVRILVVSQLITAFGPLFYLFATPETSWLLFGSAACYMAYVGLNVALPQTQLQFAPSGKGSTYLATYGATGGVLGFFGALLGGVIYQRWPADTFPTPLPETPPVLQMFFWVQIPFLVSFALRLPAVLLLSRVNTTAQRERPKKAQRVERSATFGSR